MLLYEDKVKKNRQAFADRVRQISANLDIDPNWLMAVFNFETAGTMDSAITNSIGATGLIQFMPSTARGLGVSTEELRTMSNVQQLYYVEKYLMPYKASMVRAIDVYMAVFFPAAMNKSPDWVIQTSRLSAEKIGSQNPVFDVITKDGKITVAEVEKVFLSRIPAEYQADLKKKIDSPTKFIRRNIISLTIISLITIGISILLIRDKSTIIKAIDKIK